MAAREAYQAGSSGFPRRNRVYGDESGTHRALCREKARAERGVSVYDTVSGARFGHVNVVAAKNGSRTIAPFWYTGTTAAAFFERWFKTCPLPRLWEGAVVIMDNARFQRKGVLRKLARKFRVRLLCLPPYSPDYNPMERRWADMKRWFKDTPPATPLFNLPSMLI